MKMQNYTCPFTGMAFCALERNDGGFIFYNVVDNSKIEIVYNPETKCFEIPKESFRHVETLSVKEASEVLGVSRQRIDTLLKNGTIACIKNNNVCLLIKNSVLEYKKYRKTGRPKKEG